MGSEGEMYILFVAYLQFDDLVHLHHLRQKAPHHLPMVDIVSSRLLAFGVLQ